MRPRECTRQEGHARYRPPQAESVGCAVETVVLRSDVVLKVDSCGRQDTMVS